jgi:hypothetical protein
MPRVEKTRASEIAGSKSGKGSTYLILYLLSDSKIDIQLLSIFAIGDILNKRSPFIVLSL